MFKAPYDEAFKRSLVRQVVDGKSVIAIAKETRIPQPTISRWLKRYKTSVTDTAPKVEARPEEFDTRIKELERTNLNLTNKVNQQSLLINGLLEKTSKEDVVRLLIDRLR